MWYTRCCSTVFSIDSPHVDEVLSERHRLCVARHRDSAIEVGSGLAVVAVGDADHGAAQLPTFLIHTYIQRYPISNKMEYSFGFFIFVSMHISIEGKLNVSS